MNNYYNMDISQTSFSGIPTPFGSNLNIVNLFFVELVLVNCWFRTQKLLILTITSLYTMELVLRKIIIIFT